MKKYLCVIISISVLICSLMPMSFSASAYTYEDYDYEIINGNQARITGYNGDEMDLYIPSVLNNFIVTEIGETAFMDNDKVSSWYLPSGLKAIGDGAFYMCQAENIYLPDSLETIGDNAFSNCWVLKEIALGKNVKNINGEMFAGCNRISSYTVDEDNEKYSSENGVLFNKDKTELIVYPAGNESESYIVPDGVKEIKSASFSDASKLKSLTVPKTLETVEKNAFNSVNRLSEINYPQEEEKWENVSVALDGNSYFINAQKNFNVTPEPCENHTKKGEGTVIKEPTCTASGSIEYYCPNCYNNFTEPIDPLGHTEETLEAVAPTYFEDGKTEGKKCSVCGDILVPQKDVKKLVLAVPAKRKATAKKKAFTLKWKKNIDATGYIIQYSTSKKFTKKTTKKRVVKKNSTVKKTVKKLKPKKVYYVRIRAYKTQGTKTVYSKWSKRIKIKTK